MDFENKDRIMAAAGKSGSGQPEKVQDTRKSIPSEPHPGATPPGHGDSELQEFDSLIGSYLDNIVQHEADSVISVSVVEVHKDHVLVDLGDKAEGVIPIQEFFDSKGNVRITSGERIEVMVLGRDEESGLIEVSYKMARVQNAWSRLEQAHTRQVPISGRVTRAVKSGVLVDMGVECFMPASQISDQRVANLEEWVNKDVEALVIDLDKDKRRAILSRRRLVEQRKRLAIEQAVGKVKEGDVVHGTVKSVLNFGVFLDIEGLDAYLPREELSWDRGVAPSSMLEVGANIKVKVLQVDRETGRIRVSRKALRLDPWQAVPLKYPEGSVVVGEVVSVTRFGAFVRIEEGLTGLIHLSELSWGKAPQRVTDFAKEGDTVRAVVLSVDMEKQRLALGLKQMVEDPWLEAEKRFPKGSIAKGTVTNLAPFGAFVKLTDDIEGLIHISDLDWEAKIKHPGEVLKAGQEVAAKVLKTDRQTRRISLGIKQLTPSPVDRYLKEHPAGSTVEGEVVRIMPIGVFVSLAPNLDGFMHVSQMDRERVEKPESLFKVGDKVRCRIIKIEKGKVSLSRKQLMAAEESKAIKQYAANPKEKGGLRLGDLLSGIQISGSKKQPKAQAAPAPEAQGEPALSAPEVRAEPAPAPEAQAEPALSAPEVQAEPAPAGEAQGEPALPAPEEQAEAAPAPEVQAEPAPAPEVQAEPAPAPEAQGEPALPAPEVQAEPAPAPEAQAEPALPASEVQAELPPVAETLTEATPIVEPPAESPPVAETPAESAPPVAEPPDESVAVAEPSSETAAPEPGPRDSPAAPAGDSPAETPGGPQQL